MALVVVPTGVKNAVEALMATAIINGFGETPKVMDAITAMGAIKTAVAELLMVWLKVAVNKNMPANNATG